MAVSVRKNKPGFKAFMTQLDGTTSTLGKEIQDALLFAEARLGRGQYQRYVGLFELLSAQRDFSSYVLWSDGLSPTERQACLLARHSAGIVASPVGGYQPNKRAIVKAAESLNSYLGSQRQEGISEGTTGQPERTRTDYSLHPRTSWYYLTTDTTSTTSEASRSRAEPTRSLFAEHTTQQDYYLRILQRLVRESTDQQDCRVPSLRYVRTSSDGS